MRAISPDRHAFLSWEQPLIFLQRVFRVYPHEVKLLLWVTAIQLFMRISSILVNNFAYTAFLKRFGVEKLPTIFVVEAILTFFVTSLVGVMMNRHRTLRVFTCLLLFFALAVGIIRGLLPMQIILLYPILFILKSQAVEILPILYWDILTDLFTTQQAKRLFTLITAGGVLGTTLGSLLTGKVARWVGADNVLLVFAGGMIVAAMLNEATERVVGAPVDVRPGRSRKKSPGRLKGDFKEAVSFSKRSPLFVYMIVIIAIPNIILPILTYQFSVVVDQTYASEQATLQFFGVFRGVSNAVMFALLLFSGRLISQWGIPTSLMFHPINYLGAFLALLFRFDILAAVYARFSTETLKTTLNNPARAVLYNFFPDRMRGLVRVFLRGTVVRASDLTGSGFLMLVKGLVDPRLLSLFAAPLVVIWMLTSVRIKRNYPSLLLNALMEKQIDWKRIEKEQFIALTSDRKAIEALQGGLANEDHATGVTCAEILREIAPPGWARMLIGALPGKPPEIQRKLIDLLGPEEAQDCIQDLIQLAGGASSETLVHLIATVMRIAPEAGLPFLQGLLDHSDPKVRMHAILQLAIHGDTPMRDGLRHRLAKLIQEEPLAVWPAPEILTDDAWFEELVLGWARGEDSESRAPAIRALGAMRHAEAVKIAWEGSGASDPGVRDAALQVLMDLGQETPVDLWLQLLGDEDSGVREKAALALKDRGEEAIGTLLPLLTSPSRILRGEILDLLSNLGVPQAQVSSFIERELRRAYGNIAFLVSPLREYTHHASVALVIERLSERNREIIEMILRLLAIVEFEDKMEIIVRAIQTQDKRDMDNAIEALQTMLHPKIRDSLIPLLQTLPLEVKAEYGKRRFGVKPLDDSPIRTILIGLLEDEDPITVSIALHAWVEIIGERPPKNVIERCRAIRNPILKEAVAWASTECKPDIQPEAGWMGPPDLIEKALCIRKIPIFEELSVGGLLLMASIAAVEGFPAGSVIVVEGEPGDALYLIFQGELAVIKGMNTVKETVLARIHKDDFFGEMALLDRDPRSATVRAESEAILLVIQERDFTRAMEEHPAIPIHICKVLSQRIRGFHDKLAAPL